MKVNKYLKYQNTVNINNIMRYNMMITYIEKINNDKKITQVKYFSKFKFYVDVIKLKIIGHKIDYIITFSKHIYKHLYQEKGLYTKYEKKIFLKENKDDN